MMQAATGFGKLWKHQIWAGLARILTSRSRPWALAPTAAPDALASQNITLNVLSLPSAIAIARFSFTTIDFARILTTILLLLAQKPKVQTRKPDSRRANWLGGIRQWE
jgi:hypothetical protein